MEEIKPTKKYYFVIIITFFIFLLLGMIFGRNESFSTSYINDNFGALSFLQNFTGLLLFLFIFLNNSLKALFVIMAGTLFGLVPIYFVAVNAFLIGVVATYVVSHKGVLVAIAGLVPHGLLEIPAIILAVVYGFWIGSGFLRSLKTKESINPMIQYSLKKYVRIILPMLLAAALIETYITPKLINYFYK